MRTDPTEALAFTRMLARLPNDETHGADRITTVSTPPTLALSPLDYSIPNYFFHRRAQQLGNLAAIHRHTSYLPTN